jgi:enamine deaminase RidA (YjgF/YER057c/UK114 family)
MGLYKRINVSSGRALEQQAHYSRALRIGDRVLQAGTTAIDRDGNVIGEGDVAKQVDAIMALAEWSMGKAGGKIEDVVRSRIYLTDISLTEPAALALAKYFRDIRPTSTLVQVSRLARPAQLIEIEFDAVDGAKDKAQRVSSGRAIEERYAYSRAIRIDDRVFISGSTALNPQGTVDTPDDMYTQARQTFDTILWALDQLGGTPGDLLNAKTFVTDLTQNEASTRARRDALGEIYPTATLLGIPALVRPDMLIEIESDAMIGAASHRREIFGAQEREKSRGYARAVEVGDFIYVSGCTSLNAAGEVEAVGDWAAQYDLSHHAIQSALERFGASLDDVICRRIFTVDGVEPNRPYGEGPAWFANCYPVSMGCRVSGLAHPDLLVEVEAVALKGAGADIEWIEPEDTDPLSS